MPFLFRVSSVCAPVYCACITLYAALRSTEYLAPSNCTIGVYRRFDLQAYIRASRASIPVTQSGYNRDSFLALRTGLIFKESLPIGRDWNQIRYPNIYIYLILNDL